MKEEALDKLLQSLPYLPTATCDTCAWVAAQGCRYARAQVPAVVRHPYQPGYLCRDCASTYTVEDNDRAAIEQAFFDRMVMCLMN